MSHSFGSFFGYLFKKSLSKWPLFLGSALSGAAFGILLASVGFWVKRQEVEYGWVFGLSVLLIACIKASQQFFSTWIVNRQIANEKIRLLSALRANWIYIKNSLSEAQIQKRLSNDFPAVVEGIWSGCVFLTSQIVTIIILVTFLFWFSPSEAFLTLCIVFTLFVVSAVLRKILYRFTSKKQNLEDQQFKNEKNLIHGFENLSTSGEVVKLQKEITAHLNSWNRNEKSLAIVDTTSDSLHWAIRFGFILLVLTPVLSTTNAITPESLYWIYILIGVCSQAYWSIHQLAFSQSHWEQARPLLEPAQLHDNRLLVPELIVSAKNLKISYDPCQFKPSIGPIDFHWKPDSRVLISGESGTGKTTLIRTILGFHASYRGILTIPDDHYKIEYISQNPFFYDGESLAKNLRLQNISDIPRELIKKLKLESFFNQHLCSDTVIGQNGVQPSKGQRTRLAILRALVFRPALLILDEPTAGLDKATAIEVLKTLKDEMKDRILIVADHNVLVSEVLQPTHVLDLNQFKLPLENAVSQNDMSSVTNRHSSRQVDPQTHPPVI